MRQIIVSSRGISDEYIQSRKKSLEVIRDISKKHFSKYLESRLVTSDLDGVMGFDDNAIMLTELVGGKEVKELFSIYADLNIQTARNDDVPYCWYAPTIFCAQLLKGLSPEVNRAVGRNIRLIPGAEIFYNNLIEDGYDVTVLTAGYQEAAEEVSERLGIEKTIGIQVKIEKGLYTTKIERFIGGHCKEREAGKILVPYGVHIGDGWSDVETLKVFPSIAYNPGCQLALNNATVSVISSSVASLSPFLNPNRTDTQIPEVVIINPDKLPVPEWVLGLSKTMKKQTLGTLVELANGGSRIDNIKSELRHADINFESSQRDFMSPDDFDRHAKKEWEIYKQENEI